MTDIRKPSSELVCSHLNLVETIAKKVRRSLPNQASLEDLIGAGTLGLLDAARKFDPRKRVPFRLYAARRIRGAILDSLRDLDTLPRTMRRRLRAAEQAVSELAQRKQRFPRDDEIAQSLRLSLKQWRKFEKELFDAGFSVRPQKSSLKLVVLAENFAAARGSPEQWAIRQELRLTLNRAIRSLPERYQKVVWLYYGCQWTMKRIGRHLGVGESRVSQIHSAALRRMRSYMNHNRSC